MCEMVLHPCTSGQAMSDRVGWMANDGTHRQQAQGHRIRRFEGWRGKSRMTLELLCDQDGKTARRGEFKSVGVMCDISLELK